MDIYVYIELAVVAIIPVLISVLVYLLDKKTSFGKWNYAVKQIIIGVVFGILAICGTEFGVAVNGVQINSRDSSVLIAGLMFGSPAGIIAGVIGGVERWIAVAWGVGSFTRLACSLSTIIAGVYAALLRKFLFEEKKPGTLISFAIGVVMEVFHMTMVFITNMATPDEAMNVVRLCTTPMVIVNSVAVMASALILSCLSLDRYHAKKTGVRISQTIQRWLLVTVLFAFAATSYFVFSLQNTIAQEQTDSLLDIAIQEVSDDIKDVSDQNTLKKTVAGMTKNRNVGETGYILIIDKDNKIVSAPKGVDVSKIEKSFGDTDMPKENETTKVTVNGESIYYRYVKCEGYLVVSVLPQSEAMKIRNVALYVNTFMEILVFAILFGLIYLLIKKVVVNQIKSINGSLSKITGGNLDEVVNVRSNEEFASLSDDINSTVDTLKKYIVEASARIDAELEFAKNIQASALPNSSTAFPKRCDFEIYAAMRTAKEVGGDFYDFYMTNNDTLNFLIADVSGKGIPAAMFMMRAKTELKTLTEGDLPLYDVFTHGNQALCEGNDAGMFVTAWQGSLDLSNGTLQYVNAGHNPPLVRHKDGKFEYLRSRAGFVLAGMEGFKYKTQEIQLEPGDVIYLYTDGVTEATSSDGELYGEDRLLDVVNAEEYDSMESLCLNIQADVDKFVGDAPQFDDITMVALKYAGLPTIRFEKAVISDINAVTEFVETQLEKAQFPMKAVYQINVAIDEIFSNIVKYGYPNEPGPVDVKLTILDDPKTVYVRFADSGIPYNPLTKDDPNTALSAEERSIGGLGIYVVKKTMDDVKYKYENGQNVLTITKKI